MIGDRFPGGDVFGALDPFGSQFVGPGEEERDWKTEHENKDDQSGSPVGNVENRKSLGRNLDEQPTHDAISDRDFVNIPPFQFGEKILGIHGSLFRYWRKFIPTSAILQ